MRKLIIFFVFLIVLLLTFFCSDQSSNKTDKQEIKQVYNKTGEGGKTVTLELKEIFRIEAGKDVNFSGSAKDSLGNIYIIDPNRTKVYKFNPEGKLIQEMIGKGAGPGELSYISMLKIINNRVYASSGRKIALFDTSGKVLEEYKFKQYVFPLKMINPAQLLVSCYSVLKDKKGKDQRYRVLELKDLAGKTLKTFIKKQGIGSTSIRKKNFRFNFGHSAISTDLDFDYAPYFEKIFYSIGNEYKIYRCNLQGKIDLIIHKDDKPAELSPADRDEVVAGFRDTAADLKDMIRKNLPKHFTIINNLNALPKGYLMVSRVTGANSSSRDLFDPLGNFLYVVELPKNHNYRSIQFTKNRLIVIDEINDNDIYIEYEILNMPWTQNN